MASHSSGRFFARLSGRMKKTFLLALGLLAASFSATAETGAEDCRTISAAEAGEPGLKYVVCEEKASPTDVNKSFFIINSRYQDVPDFIKNQFLDVSEKISGWERVYISVSTENDDLATFGICKASSTKCSDDVGYTAGSAITLGGVYKNDYDVQLKIANALYSHGVPGTFRQDPNTGERFEDQYIRSALLMEFLVNSARQNNLFYWSLGAGFIALSSEEKFGLLDAARQQRGLHNILNSFDNSIAVHRRNFNDGQSDQWGFYLLAGVGMQKFLSSTKHPYNSRSYAQITTRMSTLSRHSELRLELGSDLGRAIGTKGRISTGANVATTAHAQGRINEASVFVKYETGKRFETSLSFTCARGTLANYASYNLPNTATGKPDCTYRLLAKYYLK